MCLMVKAERNECIGNLLTSEPAKAFVMHIMSDHPNTNSYHCLGEKWEEPLNGQRKHTTDSEPDPRRCRAGPESSAVCAINGSLIVDEAP